jgi:hypothetical protein
VLVNTSCGVCVFIITIKARKKRKAVNHISPNVNVCAVRLPCNLQPVMPNNNNNNSKKDVKLEIKVASIS